MYTKQTTIEIDGEIFMIGDMILLETTSDNKYRLPLVEIYGDHIFLDDEITRIQLNYKTGKILVLSKQKEVLDYTI